ncbi:MAG: FtsQ-type POTRA domain-containing protein [Coriobacteriales bacterium]
MGTGSRSRKLSEQPVPNPGLESPRRAQTPRDVERRSAHPRGGRDDRTHANAGQSIAQKKREERERRRAERARRTRMRLLVAAVVIALLAGGAVVLYRSQVFDIRSVQVTGTHRLTPDEVRSRAAVPADATLLRYPQDEMRERLLTQAWIADVQITRDYPHTLKIRVTERVPQAIVDTGEEFWIVDKEGYVVAQQSLEATSNLVVVRDTPGLDLAAGRKTSSEVVMNALALLGGVSDELRSRTRAVSAPSIDETTLITKDNVEILMGEAVDLEKKDAIVLKILHEQAGAVVFIDVRNTERPVARGLDE